MGNSFYTYILKCVDNTYYIGYTVDLAKRLKVHNNKKGAKYTRGRTPVSIVYFESYSNKVDALRQEYALKKLSRVEKDYYIKENITLEKQKIMEDINENI